MARGAAANIQNTPSCQTESFSLVDGPVGRKRNVNRRITRLDAPVLTFDHMPGGAVLVGVPKALAKGIGVLFQAAPPRLLPTRTITLPFASSSTAMGTSRNKPIT